MLQPIVSIVSMCRVDECKSRRNEEAKKRRLCEIPVAPLQA